MGKNQNCRSRNFTAVVHRAAVVLCFLMLPLSLSRAEVTLTIGDGTGYPGSSGQVVVSLDNQNDKVRGVELDVCDVDDYLSCTICEAAERTSGFECIVNELGPEDSQIDPSRYGCCNVTIFSFGGDLIDEGNGTIFTLTFDISEDAPSEECRDLTAEGLKVANKDGDPFPPSEIVAESGEVCFLKVSPVTITPNPIWKSHWIPLPYLMIIHGSDTHFQPWITTVTFSPDSSVVPFSPLVWDEYYIWIIVWAMPGWPSGEEDQTVIVTVATEEEIVEGNVEIQLLPLLLGRNGFF